MGAMTKWSEEEKQTWAVSKLLEKREELGRLPHKDDFDAVTLSRIKAFLGPWPHALAKAGLKEARPKPPKRKRRASREGTGAFKTGTVTSKTASSKGQAMNQNTTQ